MKDLFRYLLKCKGLFLAIRENDQPPVRMHPLREGNGEPQLFHLWAGTAMPASYAQP